MFATDVEIGLFGRMPPRVVTFAIVFEALAMSVVTWVCTAAIGVSTLLIVLCAALAKLETVEIAELTELISPVSVLLPIDAVRLFALDRSVLIRSLIDGPASDV